MTTKTQQYHWDAEFQADRANARRVRVTDTTVLVGEDDNGVTWLWLTDVFKFAPIEHGQERQFAEFQWSLNERGVFECPASLNGVPGTLALLPR